MTCELDEKTIIGAADRDSTGGVARIETHRVALDAMEKQDLERLFAAYATTVEDRATLEDALIRTAALLNKKPIQVDPIEAIRDVALAAIKLARDVALGKADAT